MSIEELKQECKYCYREVDDSGLEGFRCTNKTVNMETSWCRPKNANMPCTICEYYKPREEIGMTVEEAIADLMLANADVSYRPKDDSIDMAIIALKKKPKKGEWLRMSDLSEQEDYRYKCSYCGNVVHYKNKMDLYTFNRWCGRCGSNNERN